MATVNIKSTHAHPETLPSATPPPGCDIEQKHSSQMGCKQPFRDKLHLRGLQNASRETATDVFCPDVRRSPFSCGGFIEHLDVISRWKGLNLEQAEEVFAWERIFQEALESLVFDHVREISITLPATGTGTFKLTQDIEVVLEDLVCTMVHLYCSSKPDVKRKRTWSASDRDLPSFAYNFVRTRDCFIDTFPHPRIRVELSFSLPAELVSEEVIWQTPAIDFGDLPDNLTCRAAITPVYQSPVCGNINGFVTFPDHFQYSVDEGASGVIVNWSTLIATTAICFPGEVRFQRTSRYLIKSGSNINHELYPKPTSKLRARLPNDIKGVLPAKNYQPSKGKAKRSTTESFVGDAVSETLPESRSIIEVAASKRPRLHLQARTHCHQGDGENTSELWVNREKEDSRHRSTDSSDEALGMNRKPRYTDSCRYKTILNQRAESSSASSSSTSPNDYLSPESPPPYIAHNSMDDQDIIRRNYAEFSTKTQHSRITTDEALEAEKYENMFLEEISNGGSLFSGNTSAISLEE